MPRLLPRTIMAASTLLATALAGAVLIAPPAQSQPEPVRIMPLGDSITGSPGCWRALLWNELRDTGYTNIDFVGTLGPQGCGVPYDGDNEGHGGALVTTVASQNQLPGWLVATDPDVVLMHFGTNDVWSARSTGQVLAAYDTLVDQMRAQNPAMHVLVAQIIPMDPARSCAECGQRVRDLNAAIPGWAAGKSTAASPVSVVDQWTGFSATSDTYDGVHPNASGDQKLADRWYPPLAAVLDGAPAPTTGPPPSPPASPSASPSPSPSAPPTTPGPGGGCDAAYQITGEWPGGFQGGVTVTNTGTAAISGWTVRWTFTGGQQVTQFWGAQVVQAGADVTADNQPWNGALAPGASVSFGFLGSWNGTNPAAVASCAAT